MYCREYYELKQLFAEPFYTVLEIRASIFWRPTRDSFLYTSVEDYNFRDTRVCREYSRHVCCSLSDSFSDTSVADCSFLNTRIICTGDSIVDSSLSLICQIRMLQLLGQFPGHVCCRLQFPRYDNNLHKGHRGLLFTIFPSHRTRVHHFAECSVGRIGRKCLVGRTI